MKLRIVLLFTIATGVLLVVQPSPGAPFAGVKATRLRCEYAENPLGISVTKPRLSWVLEPGLNAPRGVRQMAYQILVADDPDLLKVGKANLWDSGRVESDQSIQVAYDGKPLASQMHCWWRVQIWDQDGRPSGWSAPARWSMGLLQASDWHGKWIGQDEPEKAEKERNPLSVAQWIWFPEENPAATASLGTRYFRRTVTVPTDDPIRKAVCILTADNDFSLYVNGERIGTGSNFKQIFEFDLTGKLKPGANLVAVAAKNVGEAPNPAGVIGLVQIETVGGAMLMTVTDREWKAAGREEKDWQWTHSSDATWQPAQVLGDYGMSPWKELGYTDENRRLPARMLRHEFAVDKKIRQATVSICGLGLYELYLNGKRVGDHVLAPGLTEYPKRVFYETFDVTDLVERGLNAVGVILGNGRYFAPRGKVPTDTRTYGYPKLRFQLAITFKDGSTKEIVSDEHWKLTTDGPIQANNEYDGEEYDARKEMPGWASPKFDDSAWQAARVVQGPEGLLLAQPNRPIRVVETLRPISVKSPRAGVYVYDLGQNMVGWCRLKVNGPAGTTVSLRHAEVLKTDGTLYLDNIRSAKVTDLYTLKGDGTEVWEPRFTYHGFRFVEVKGFPGQPDLGSIEGRVVNDDVERAGEFSCSNELLNQIYRNVYWGVRGNYRSLPTDCPQRDERQGWLGDRSAESRGESYLFDIAALYRKWVQDMADAQKDSGSVPDVCPSYWPLYSDNVTWPSSTVIIPGMLYDQYGDRRVLEEHYASMKKWIEHMSGFVTNGIIARDSYGDWCVPPEDPRLIHSQDPKRKTAAAVLATAYFIYDLRLMERYARLLGRAGDTARFGLQASQMQEAFNRRFLDRERGWYDNGTQTSCVLPLAFGLVPEDYRARVFNHLVQKINIETRGHIGTGLVGGQWLLRVLSDNGRPDLALTLASQRAYPSWGYMIDKGATTIWELWNGDTADPAMNSGNHVMLVGDYIIWLHEYVAGIRGNPEAPGFKHILMQPHPLRGLSFARATHQSPHGLISSDWKTQDGLFTWEITVPANTAAAVYVPASDPGVVMEGQRPAREAPGVQYLGYHQDRAVYAVGSGRFKFTSR